MIQGLINTSCNTLTPTVKNPNGRGSWLVMTRPTLASNKTVKHRFPLVPNPSTILAYIPSNITHFTVLILCSVFFLCVSFFLVCFFPSTPLHPDSQNPFCILMEKSTMHIDCHTSGVYRHAIGVNYFSRTLNENLRNLIFLCNSFLI